MPNYELVQVFHEKYDASANQRHKRSIENVKVQAEGKEVILNLTLNDHVLYGEKTAIYLASDEEIGIVFRRVDFVSKRVSKIRILSNGHGTRSQIFIYTNELETYKLKSISNS